MYGILGGQRYFLPKELHQSRAENWRCMTFKQALVFFFSKSMPRYLENDWFPQKIKNEK